MAKFPGIPNTHTYIDTHTHTHTHTHINTYIHTHRDIQEQAYNNALLSTHVFHIT